MAASSASRFCEVSEEDLQNLISNAIPQKTSLSATKYGMKIFNGKNMSNNWDICGFRVTKVITWALNNKNTERTEFLCLYDLESDTIEQLVGFY